MNKQTKFERLLSFLAGKGFYIILFICVAAIGVSGYALFFSSDRDSGAFTGAESIDWLKNTTSPSPSVTPKTVVTPTPEMRMDNQDDALAVVKPTEVPILPSPPVREPVIPSPNRVEDVVVSSPSPSPTPTPAVTAKPSEKPAVSPTQFFWPVSGEVIVEHAFVKSKTLGHWRDHDGIDISANLGAKVMAAGDGVVKNIDHDPQLGTYVTVEHPDGMLTLYANLQKNPAVVIDQKVTAGDIIGGVGDTSTWEAEDDPHLHFEMYKEGKAVNPLDYLPKKE